MEQTVLFEKNGVVVEATTNNNMVLTGDKNPLIITLDCSNNKTIKFKLLDDGLAILSGRHLTNECSINEYNLCNAIIDKLFSGITEKEAEQSSDKFNLGQKIELPQKTGNYLVKTSGDTSYVYEDGYLFSLYLNRLAVIDRIEKYNGKVSSQEAIRANEVLIELIEDMPERDTKSLINNDLHFQHRDSVKNFKEQDDIFGNVLPVYSCDRRKVSGIIKHMSRKMKKQYDSPIKKVFDILNDKFPNSVSKEQDSLSVELNDISFELFNIDTKMRADIKSDLKDGSKFNLVNYNITSESVDNLVNMLSDLS